MKERLLTLLTAIAALLLTLFLLSPQSPDSHQPVSLPTTEDRGKEGLKGLFVWLQREHIPAVSFRKRYGALLQDRSLANHGNVLFVSLPAPQEILEAEWQALSSWLERGNSLVILGAVYHHPLWKQGEDCFCDVKQFLARYHWTLANAKSEDINADKSGNTENTKSLRQSLSDLQASLKAHQPQTSRLSALSATSILKSVNAVEAQTLPELLQSPWTLTSGDTDNLALRLFGVDNQEAVAGWQMKAGNGQIVLMLTPDIFSNYQLNHANNARFFANLLSQALSLQGKVLFDDYHFGLSELYDPQNFFKDARLHKTLGCLALLWLFYAVGYSPRLAPVRPKLDQLSSVDFIATTAQFFARRVGKRQLAEALVKQLLMDICQRRHLAGEAQALLWLNQHSQIKTRQLALLKLALAKQRLSLPLLTNTLIDIRTTLL